MAIYHLSATPVQRSKGQTATAGAAYRSASVIRDERLAVTYNFTRKRGVVQSEILAPDNAPAWVYDRAELWNRAELAEKRYDGQPAREIRVALPHELTDEQRADLVFRYARDTFVRHGMIADISIHRPDRHGDERNHHAHIYVTMRELDGDHFSTKKNRDWNKTETLEYWREQWEDYQNAALEDSGSDTQVDHRTLEAQGIDRIATEHLGREASGMERRGYQSRIGDENRAIAEHNERINQLLNELAALDAEIAREMAREPQKSKHGVGIEEPPDVALSLPTALEVAPEPVKSWEEIKREAQSPFRDEVVMQLERDIRRYGEVQQWGLGKDWKVTMQVIFDELFYNTPEPVAGIWQDYIRSREPDRDDPDKGDIER